jgi:hypothetical protein
MIIFQNCEFRNFNVRRSKVVRVIWYAYSFSVFNFGCICVLRRHLLPSAEYQKLAEQDHCYIDFTVLEASNLQMTSEAFCPCCFCKHLSFSLDTNTCICCMIVPSHETKLSFIYQWSTILDASTEFLHHWH